MNLNDKLIQTTKDVQEAQRLEAKDLFEDVETYLLERAGRGKTNAEFVYVGWPEEVLQELQKLLIEQGLTFSVAGGNRILISWDSEK